MRLASVSEQPAPRELASGIDALYFSGHGDLSPRLLADLEEAKLAAQAQDEVVALDLGDATVLVEGRAWGRYPYRLQTPHGLVGVTDRKRLPPIRVQPLTEHLHAVGAAESVDWFADVLAEVETGLRLTASRVDVFSDWQGLDLTVDDRERFVGRARRLDSHEESAAWTGFEFGRRTTGTVAARIYDKTLDVTRKRPDWWYEKWGSGFDRSLPVTRVEFEFGRKGLRQYGIDTTDDALRLAPALWLAATTDWLTLRTPSEDETRSRWPLAEEWLTVQRPSFAEHALGLERILEGRVQGSLRSLMPGLVGYLSTFAALTGCRAEDELYEALRPALADYAIISHKTFPERVRDKRVALRLA